MIYMMNKISRAVIAIVVMVVILFEARAGVIDSPGSLDDMSKVADELEALARKLEAREKTPSRFYTTNEKGFLELRDANGLVSNLTMVVKGMEAADRSWLNILSRDFQSGWKAAICFVPERTNEAYGVEMRGVVKIWRGSDACTDMFYTNRPDAEFWHTGPEELTCPKCGSKYKRDAQTPHILIYGVNQETGENVPAPLWNNKLIMYYVFSSAISLVLMAVTLIALVVRRGSPAQ